MTNKHRQPTVHCTRSHQRGSITSIALAWWALTVLSLVTITNTGRQLLIRQRTQHAADAVALAWVSRGSGAGAIVASAYDMAVTMVQDSGNRVRVWVTRGDRTSSATAQYICATHRRNWSEPPVARLSGAALESIDGFVEGSTKILKGLLPRAPPSPRTCRRLD